MATQQIKDILSTPRKLPSLVFKPNPNGPLQSRVTFSRSDPAWTWDPVKEKYVKKSPGTVRHLYDERTGAYQGVLAEPVQKTNEIQYSSDLSQWSTSNATLGASASSVIENETATAYKGSASSGSGYLFQNSAGVFTASGKEVAYALMEQDTATEAGIRVRDRSSGSNIGVLSYNFSNDNLSLTSQSTGTVEDTYYRIINDKGPNGGKLVQIIMRYSGQTGGNNRQVMFLPDRTGSGDSTIFHHFQLEAQGGRSTMPKVTTNSPTTVEAEIFYLDTSGIFNTDRLSVITSFTPRSFWTNTTAYLLNPEFDFGVGYAELNSNDSPFEVMADSNVNLEFSNAAPAFEESTLAMSVIRNGDLRAAFDGQAQTVSNLSNTSLLDGDRIQIAAPGGFQGGISKILVTPTDLSEIELKARSVRL